MGKLEGKVAVVTGGARGIGRAVVEQCVAEGMKVVVADVEEGALAKVEDELAEPAAWATKYETAKSTARHTAAKRAVDDAYAALEEHLERTGV